MCRFKDVVLYTDRIKDEGEGVTTHDVNENMALNGFKPGEGAWPFSQFTLSPLTNIHFLIIYSMVGIYFVNPSIFILTL